MEKLKNTRILVGIICLFLGTILPFIGSNSIHLWISLYNYWEGKIALVLIVANTLFIFKDYVQKYAPQFFERDIGLWIKNANQKYVLIPVGITVLLELYLMKTVGIFSEYRGILDFGIGLYLSILGTGCLIAHCFVYKNPNENNINNTNGNYSNNMNMNNNYNNQMMNNNQNNMVNNNMNNNFNNNYNNQMMNQNNNMNQMNNNYSNQQQNNINNN